MVWEKVRKFFCVFTDSHHCEEQDCQQCPYCKWIESSGKGSRLERKDERPNGNL